MQLNRKKLRDSIIELASNTKEVKNIAYCKIQFNARS